MLGRIVLAVCFCTPFGMHAAWSQNPPVDRDDAVRLLETLLGQLRADAGSGQDKPTDASPAAESQLRSVGIGAANRAVAPPTPVPEIRIYDVADLFAIAPSHRALTWAEFDSLPILGPMDSSGPASSGGMGGMGGGMGGMFNVPATAKSGEVDQWQPTPHSLMEVIRDTIEAEWDSRDRMTWIGSSLLVSTLPETHAQIRSLLDKLEERWNARVTFKIHVYWLWLTDAELEAMNSLAHYKEKFAPIAMDRLDFERWLAEVPKSDDRPANVHATLHGHNGQTLAWVGGSERRSIATWSEIGKNRMMPNVMPVHSGAACEVTPMLAHASLNVTMVVRSRYAMEFHPTAGEEQVGAEPQDGASHYLPDQRQLTGQTISGTVRMPVNTAVLIGGGSGSKPMAEGYQLALVASNEFVAPPNR